MATVVKVTGSVDGVNRSAVLHHLAKFTQLDAPLIVDLRGIDARDIDSIRLVIRTLRNECRRVSTGFTIVADTYVLDTLTPRDGRQEFASATSVGEALQFFIERIKERRSNALLTQTMQYSGDAWAPDAEI